jgi:hypothetical protein
MGRHRPTVPLVTITLSFYPLDGEGLPTTETTPEATLEDRQSTKLLSASGGPMPAALMPTHDVLERNCSIANARRRFTLVAVHFRTLQQQT